MTCQQPFQLGAKSSPAMQERYEYLKSFLAVSGERIFLCQQ